MDGNTQVVVLGTGDAWYEIHSVIMNINIKAVSAHTLITMKMSPTVFIRAVMRSWFRQDLNHAGLHTDSYEIWCDSDCQRNRRT